MIIKWLDKIRFWGFVLEGGIRWEILMRRVFWMMVL